MACDTVSASSRLLIFSLNVIRRKVLPRTARRRSTTLLQAVPKDVSQFDGLKLDESYYEEVGLTPEEAKEELDLVYNTDPEYASDEMEGATISLGNFSEEEPESYNDEGDDTLSNLLNEQSDTVEAETNERAPPFVPFGPAAILIAGFREHELGMVRANVDMIDGHGIKVIPCGGLLLHSRVGKAINEKEPDWEKPSEGSVWRSAWGSQRTILFAGLAQEDMLTIVDILEGSGLPALVVAVATEENHDRILGEVLAEAVKAQRHWKPKDYLIDSMSPQPPSAAITDQLQRDEQQIGKLTTGKAQAAANAIPQSQPANLALDRSTDADPTSDSFQRSLEASLANNRDPLAERDISPTAVTPSSSAETLRQVSQTPSDSMSTDIPGSSQSYVAEGANAVRDAQQSANQAHARNTLSSDAGSNFAPPDTPDLFRSGPSPAEEQFGSSKASAGEASRGEAQSQATGSGIKTPKMVNSPASLPNTHQEKPSANGGYSNDTASKRSSSAEGKQSQNKVDASTGLSAFADIESSEFANQQRVLRQEAADEMERRAKQSQASKTPGYMQADNVIDAAASGEDLSTILGPRVSQPQDPEVLLAARRADARKKMADMLQEMRLKAKDLPEEKRRKYAADLKALENDQDSISSVLSELGADLDSIPKNDRDAVKTQLREEAWQPTKDAIGAALACGISGDEVRDMVVEAERAKAGGQGGWYPSVTTPQKQQ